MDEERTTTDAHYDVVIVGARCAGSSAAIRLARAGLSVALVDADTFPSDTISTHVIFPDGLADLDQLGVLARLEAEHELSFVRYAWRVLGHDVSGTFTQIAGRDRCLSVRRITLDATLVTSAVEAGAVLHSPRRVVDLVGKGTASDPVRGVVLDGGQRLLAGWVLGADGQRSTIANRLGLATTDERAGEMAFLLGYWRGLPPSDWCTLDIRSTAALMSVPVEDGLHLLNLAGPADLTRGSRAQVDARYHEGVRAFPGLLNHRLLARAELVGRVVAVPETMMRGLRRQASGHGWALLGDAGNLKHPSTAQGIGDALAQARYVATDLLAGGDLRAFGAWRDARSAGHDEWSFTAARFPRARDAGLYAGIGADGQARQQFLDTFTKQARISDVLTAPRLHRWRLAAAYEEGVRQIRAAAQALTPDQLGNLVPACPDWSVRDLLAHLAGVARDAVRGQFFDGALLAWDDPGIARRREQWTAGHVAASRGTDLESILASLERDAAAFVLAVRRGRGPAAEVPAWMLAAPVGDLAVHREDLVHALAPLDEAGQAEQRSPLRDLGFELYVQWLGSRIRRRGLAALRLTDGEGVWVAGDGEPVTSVRAGHYELFRTISGRRGLTSIRALAWQGDCTPYLDVISPYPLPTREPPEPRELMHR